MAKIIPTILTDNEKTYHDQLLICEKVVDLVQVDMIDGEFANNKTVGVDVVAKYPTSVKVEPQLMVNYPYHWVEELVKLDYVWRIIVPFEAHKQVQESLIKIKDNHKLIGLSINPATPLSAVLSYLDKIDLLLVMSVVPGFAGQKFMPEVLEKVREAKKIKPGLTCELDGGINFENVGEAAASGADFLCANTVLYSAPDFGEAYTKLAKVAETPS